MPDGFVVRAVSLAPEGAPKSLIAELRGVLLFALEIGELERVASSATVASARRPARVRRCCRLHAATAVEMARRLQDGASLEHVSEQAVADLEVMLNIPRQPRAGMSSWIQVVLVSTWRAGWLRARRVAAPAPRAQRARHR